MSTQFAIAVLLDLVLGDPKWMPHPIRALGWVASQLEKVWRATRIPLKPAGVLFWISIVAVVCLTVWISLPWFSVYWIWMFLALRSLDMESWAVARHVNGGDLASARSQLAMIVGRDTAALNDEDIYRAVVETIAENLSDAVIAPLFYLALGGPIVMGAYKAINTLDSMVGYKNERYREFGWFSARMDDVANYVPARLSAALVWLCALCLQFEAGKSMRITLRDGGSHPSPNSGYPEAAFAGALGIQLGGTSFYNGVPSLKPFLGEKSGPVTLEAVRRSRLLLYGSSVLMILGVWAVLRWH